MTNKDLVPAHPLENLHKEVDRLFGGLFDDLAFPRWRLVNAGNMPRVDFKQTEAGYELDAELPGVAAADVRLDLANGVLTLKGEKKSSHEEKAKDFIRVERSYGSFSRSFTLPDDADGDKITATAKDGIVTIAIPRKAGAALPARSIEIKTAA